VLGALHLDIDRWDNRFGREVIEQVNPKRASNRCTNYLDPRTSSIA
jgi:hypothetical protein